MGLRPTRWREDVRTGKPRAHACRRRTLRAHANASYSVAQLSGYYQNIAIVAALTGGFVLSSTLTPSFDAVDDHTDGGEDGWKFFMAVSAAAIFAMFLACVLDCILLDNSIRQIAEEKFLLDFLNTNSALLRWPLLLFIFGVVLTFLNLSATVWVLYGSAPAYVALGVSAVIGCAIFRRRMARGITAVRLTRGTCASFDTWHGCAGTCCSGFKSTGTRGLGCDRSSPRVLATTTHRRYRRMCSALDVHICAMDRDDRTSLDVVRDVDTDMIRIQMILRRFRLLIRGYTGTQ